MKYNLEQLKMSLNLDKVFLRSVVERSGFGVCGYLGEKMGIPHSVVRKYFIYLSFITVGSPLALYLITAFWMNIRVYIRDSKSYLID